MVLTRMTLFPVDSLSRVMSSLASHITVEQTNKLKQVNSIFDAAFAE